MQEMETFYNLGCMLETRLDGLINLLNDHM